jgi:hypothetical protein
MQLVYTPPASVACALKSLLREWHAFNSVRVPEMPLFFSEQ